MAKGTMTYRKLGKHGAKVSTLSIGGWTTYGGSMTEEKTIRDILILAFDSGINFFDIADIYAHGAAESVMGKVLREFPRHELVISSKLFWPMSDDVNDRGLSRKHIMESVEKSLKRIGTDYLDLYFCHRFDEDTPLDETARAMDDLVHQGKILYWGTSEWSGDQLEQVNKICERRNLYAPAVEQPQYSLLARKRFETDVEPVANELGMGLVVWSPLASGVLTGKYDNEIPPSGRLARMDWLREILITPQNIERVRQFKSLADEAGCSRSQLALQWTAMQKNISSVITGATSIQQLKENLGCMNVKIDATMMRKIYNLFAE